MDRDGSAEREILDTTAYEISPAWSPDGSSIVFSSDLDGDYELYEIAPDGRNLRQVTSNDVADLYPDWQPKPQPAR